MALKSSFALAPLALLIACGSAVGPEPDDTDPIDEPDAPLSQIAGTYEVTSKYDLSLSPDLPPILGNALGPLSGLSDNPAGTLIDLLKGSSSGISDVIDGLPGFLQDILEQQINQYIEDKLFENTPVAEQIVDYVDMISTLLTNIEVITSLEVGTSDEAGNANANHTLVGMAFLRDGERTEVATPELLNTLSIARDVSVNANIGAGTIDIGDHAFTVPLGDFAVKAYHSALETQFGVTDLGAALNGMIDCQGLAADVGDICIDNFCIVSEAQVESFCVEGLNKAAEEVDKKIAELEVAELHMVGGTGTLKLSGSTVGTLTGNWDSTFGINGNPFALPSSFEATRK